MKISEELSLSIKVKAYHSITLKENGNNYEIIAEKEDGGLQKANIGSISLCN